MIKRRDTMINAGYKVIDDFCANWDTTQKIRNKQNKKDNQDTVVEEKKEKEVAANNIDSDELIDQEIIIVDKKVEELNKSTSEKSVSGFLGDPWSKLWFY